MFSSYAEQLQQGWRLLREVPVSPRGVDLQQSPPSFPRIIPERLAETIADHEAGQSAYGLADKGGHDRDTIMKHLVGAGVRSRVAVPTDDEIYRWQELRTGVLALKPSPGEWGGITRR